jgi:exosortase O
MAIIKPFSQTNNAASRFQLQLGRGAANLAILGLWLWLYRPVFAYLSIIFTREDFRTNQLVLLGVVGLIVARLRRQRFQPRFDVSPQFHRPALLMTLGCSIFYLLVERFLDINTLSASLFGLASYGLLGLWLAPSSWRRGLPAILLLIGTLPFGAHMQTFIGYPVRILTAGLVQEGLATAGIGSVGVDTILILENGVSHVDLPCSGVKSLWTGMLFLIAATWIERRPLNRRWLLIALLFGGLLLTANLVRVGVLVLVGQVAGWRLAAEMLHVPLGVLGFVAACLAAVAFLRLPPVGFTAPLASPRTGLDRPAWLAPALAATILALVLSYTPRPQAGLAQPPPAWDFPAELAIEPMPLTPDEVAWLTRDGAESANRLRFEWRGISGSMILITSRTWRAHHRPERCFEVYGLSLDDSRPHLVRPDFPLRLVTLGTGQGHTLLSAGYWFQSPTRTTDDYASRIWADLAPRRQRWVLVSILLDGVYEPNDPDLQALYIILHEVVARKLEPDPYSDTSVGLD